MKKKLPLGLQTFSELIQGNYLYVDKTRHLLNLIDSGKYVFLSRPRRFGKSLLVSTLKALWEGRQELFQGLDIYDQFPWLTYPVIHLDLSTVTYSDGLEIFKKTLTHSLLFHTRHYEVSVQADELNSVFEELIVRLAERYQRPVVVLIDEYDKPILDHLTDPEKAQANRDLLRNFYTILKASDAYLKWVFLTGVSKFSRVSIFSGLNNLQEVTQDESCATLLGITQVELEENFAEHLTALQTKLQMNRPHLLAEIERWYNGYSWDGVQKVYNPFSLLNLFAKLKFSNYWFTSGTPTFLIKLLKTQNYPISQLSNRVVVGESVFDNFEISQLNLHSLLFQSGYLTVKQVESLPLEATCLYHLGFPNAEVKDALLNYLLAEYAEYEVTTLQPLSLELKKTLQQESLEDFMTLLRSLFAKIPYTLHVDQEAYYHSLFYMILSLLGVEIDLEVLTDKGRIDGVLVLAKQIYLIEFKYGRAATNLTALTTAALTQIKDRRYYEKYLMTGKKILLLGVAFVGKEIGYQVETWVAP